MLLTSLWTRDVVTPRKVEVVRETWFLTKERDVLIISMSAVGILSDVTPYVLVGTVLRCCGEWYCIQIYVRRKKGHFETSVPICQSTSRHVPKYSNPSIHRCV